MVEKMALQWVEVLVGQMVADLDYYLDILWDQMMAEKMAEVLVDWKAQ